ncbi:MAG: hypothetical protein PWP54_353 [Thermosipho sp. (in: thermotogales)]|nr:hypothetical protein [Thermosipho sp. (in: thermotogales)]MDK2900823.1 hypothetical protein [Thermosipho sp. (in: thermotogales)]
MKRYIIFLLLVFGIFGFSSNLENVLNKENMLIIQYKSLLLNNGIQGSDSWVSVNGFVYDVSYLNSWINGEHANGRFKSGNEYTSELYLLSPHGSPIIEKYEPLGILGFTIDDLKLFNGKNNSKAFISYEGTIYDVTYSKTWREKIGFDDAGKDLTYFIKNNKLTDFKNWDNVFEVGLLIISYNELNKYNGKNGNKAYVAVEGIVYDVSYSKRWKEGNHMNRHNAGEELTYEIIKLSPHGLKKLDAVYKIGYLVFEGNTNNYSIKDNKVYKNEYKIGYILK